MSLQETLNFSGEESSEDVVRQFIQDFHKPEILRMRMANPWRGWKCLQPFQARELNILVIFDHLPFRFSPIMTNKHPQSARQLPMQPAPPPCVQARPHAAIEAKTVMTRTSTIFFLN